jgi:8-oxo-dGTP pyrophosphatase MutT (NUDIX family)
MSNSDPVKKISAGGVVYHNGKFLLIKWKSEGTVELPKGTVETGETLEDAALREVLEETGYKGKIIDKLNTFNHVFTWHDGVTYDKTVHYFLMLLDDDKKFRHQRQENEDFINKWVPIHDAEQQLTHSDTKEAVRLAIASLGAKAA